MRDFTAFGNLVESALPPCRSCKPACTEIAFSCLKGKNEARDDLDKLYACTKELSMRLSGREGSAGAAILLLYCVVPGQSLLLGTLKKRYASPEDGIYTKCWGRICVASERLR